MDVVSTTLQDLLADILRFLPNLFTALLIFVASLYAAGLLGKLIRAALERRKTDAAIILLIVKVARWSIVILGTFASLQQVGFNVSAFLAGLGILGFTIGFALQDVSKNIISGLLLLLEQPFNIGDLIEVNGYSGKVGRVDLRATELYTQDGQNVLIPNADVFTNPIKNYSRYYKRRLELPVRVVYDSDLELVRQTTLGAIAAIPGLVQDPPPRVIFDNFGEFSIDFTVYFWIDINAVDHLDATNAAVTRIKTAFEQNGIRIPSPIHTMVMEN
jgi:small conductance mechanosensitive channel